MCVFNKFWISSCTEHFDNIIFLFSFFFMVFMCLKTVSHAWIYLCVTSECMRGYIALLSDFRFGHIFTYTHNTHRIYTLHTYVCTYVHTAHTCDTLYISFWPHRFSSLFLLLFSLRSFIFRFFWVSHPQTNGIVFCFI